MDSQPNPFLLTLLRFAFHHLYTTMAWAYDGVAYISSMGQWSNWRSTALKGLLPGEILELGHGPGHLMAQALQAGFQVIGVDVSSQMTRLAAARLERNGFPKQTIQAYAQHLPLPNEAFDAVISTFPSEYIFQKESLMEIWRVLRPEGRLIIVPMAIITGTSILDRFAAWLFKITGQCGEFQSHWLQPLQQMGFQVSVDRIRQPRAEVIRWVGRKVCPQSTFASLQPTT